MTARRTRVGRQDAPRRPGGRADVIARLEAHRDAVEVVCRTRLRSRLDADEVVREVLDEAAADPAALPEDRLLGAWLVRRAERTCRQRIRDGARPQGLAVDVRRPAALTPPDEDLIRRTLAVLDARQAQARSLQAALRPDDGPPDAVTGRRPTPRRRLLPAAGLGGIGLVPVLAPVVAVAAVVALALPSLRPPADPPTPPATADAAPVPATVPGPGGDTPVGPPAGPIAVGVGQALQVLELPAGPRTAASPPPGGPTLTIGGSAGPRVVVDDRDPQQDDLTLGFEELLGIGAGLGDALQELQSVVDGLGDAASLGDPGQSQGE